jgi:hypothetical protein
MIGHTTDKVTLALIRLAECGITWFPCGSRWFGDATNESDFDFFTTDTDESRRWLANNGDLFKFRSLPAYHDINTTAIFSTSSRLTDKQVHLILVHSSTDRVAVREKAKSLSKEERKKSAAAWNRLYKEYYGK